MSFKVLKKRQKQLAKRLKAQLLTLLKVLKTLSAARQTLSKMQPMQ